MTINGFDIYYVFENKSYTQMTYVIKLSPNTILETGFRPTSNNIPYDFSQYIPGFKAMVWSIREIK